ncbi:MAG: glycosyl hydrolase family 18 protein [Isosphaeraceae bacterium]
MLVRGFVSYPRRSFSLVSLTLVFASAAFGPCGTPAVAQSYGVSSAYADVPQWTKKPGVEFYAKGSRVRMGGVIFEARWNTNEEPGGLPTQTGWYFFDEMYDLTTGNRLDVAGARVIGYIPAWKRGVGVDYRDPRLYESLTNGIVAFLTFDEQQPGTLSRASIDTVESVIGDIVATAHAKGVAVSIAVGGADDLAFLKLMSGIGGGIGVDGDKVSFTDPDAERRLDAVVASLLDFVSRHQLDGIDLDLEGWWGKKAAEEQGGRPAGMKAHPAGYALTALAKKLRAARPRMLLSAAGFGTSWYGNNYDPGLIDYLDWVGLMTYDLTGSWKDSPVGPHSALRKIRDQRVYEAEQQGDWPVADVYKPETHGPRYDFNPIQSAEESVWYWTNPLYANWQGRGQSIPRRKIAVGVPTYGYDFSAASERGNSYRTIEYRAILSMFGDADRRPSGNIKVPGDTDRPAFVKGPGRYPFRTNLYYETPASAVEKLEFIRQIGGQGVIVWDVTGDAMGDPRSILAALGRSAGVGPRRLSLETAFGSELGNRLDVGQLESGDQKVVVAWSRGQNLFVKAGSGPVVDLKEQSRTAPSLASANGRLYLAWTGTDEQLNLRWSSDGVTWPDQDKIQPVAGKASDYSPSLAVNPTDGSLLLAWCTWGTDQQIRTVRSADGKTWVDDQVEGLEGDNRGVPGLTFNGKGQPVIAFAGVRGEARIRVSVDRKRPAVLDETTPVLPGYLHPHVAEKPAVAAIGDKVFLAWAGQAGLLLLRNEGGTLNLFSSADGRTWDAKNDKVELKNFSSNGPVALAADEVTNEMVLAFSDKGDGSIQTLRTTDGIGRLEPKSYPVHKDAVGLPAVAIHRSPWTRMSGDGLASVQLDSDETRRLQVDSSTTLDVIPGSQLLYAALFEGDDSAAFPPGARLTVKAPDGRTFDADVARDDLVVARSGDSVRGLSVREPMAGKWSIRLSVPAGVRFDCVVTSLPSSRAFDAVTNAEDRYDRTAEGVRRLKKRGLRKRFVFPALAVCYVLALGVNAGMGSYLMTVDHAQPMLPPLAPNATATATPAAMAQQFQDGINPLWDESDRVEGGAASPIRFRLQALREGPLYLGPRTVWVMGRIRPGGTTGRGAPPDPASGYDTSGIPDLDRGHLFALELGGPDVGINVVPQWRRWQRFGEWREMERRLRTIAERVGNGRAILFRVDLNYVGTGSITPTRQRWSFPASFRVRAWVYDPSGGVPNDAPAGVAVALNGGPLNFAQLNAADLDRDVIPRLQASPIAGGPSLFLDGNIVEGYPDAWRN